jgi:hypothetical protein
MRVSNRLAKKIPVIFPVIGNFELLGNFITCNDEARLRFRCALGRIVSEDRAATL